MPDRTRIIRDTYRGEVARERQAGQLDDAPLGQLPQPLELEIYLLHVVAVGLLLLELLGPPPADQCEGSIL